MEELRFEKFFLTSSWNLKIVSLHIASNWQKFCLGKSKLPIQMQPIQMQLYRKLEVFLHFFSNFVKFTSNFKHYEKKDEPYSWLIYEVIDCKKLEHLWAVNILKCPKFCSNLHGSSFVIFFDQSERSSLWKFFS